MDIADLHSEAAHDYEQSSRGAIQDNIVHRDRPPGEELSPQVADGGRLIIERQSMTFKARPAEPVKLVARFTVGLDVQLELEVGGQTFPVKLDATAVQQWREITVQIPGLRVKPKNSLIVRTTNGASFHAYHYFFLQKSVTPPAPPTPAPGS